MNKCKKCEACCHLLIEEIYQADAIREPRILEEGRCLGVCWEGTEFETIGYSLNKDIAEKCVFLKGNLCDIYETRPDLCRTFEPGGEQCLYAQKLYKEVFAKGTVD